MTQFSLQFKPHIFYQRESLCFKVLNNLHYLFFLCPTILRIRVAVLNFCHISMIFRKNLRYLVFSKILKIMTTFGSTFKMKMTHHRVMLGGRKGRETVIIQKYIEITGIAWHIFGPKFNIVSVRCIYHNCTWNMFYILVRQEY